MLSMCIFFTVVNIVVEALDVNDLKLPGLTFTEFNTADFYDGIYGFIAVILVGLTHFMITRWNKAQTLRSATE